MTQTVTMTMPMPMWRDDPHYMSMIYILTVHWRSDFWVDVQISRLRKMIEPDPSQPRYIQTVWGVGYVFVPDGTS